MRFLNAAVFLIASCLCCLYRVPANAQDPLHFEISGGAFLLNGKPFRILSGELHYPRIPREYWRHRIRMAKAMGLNTLSTYVFWNYHETSPGHFDFETDNRDIAAFVRMAQEEGMYVIIRPGPYVCAEWDLGGYPAWLLRDPGMRLRSLDSAFQERAGLYLQALGRQLAPLQWQRGGNILMVQVENEYGSFVSQIGADYGPQASHRLFMETALRQLREAGFEGPFFTADGSWVVQYGALPGILPALNGEGDTLRLRDMVNAYHEGQGPYFVAELYPGWLTHWGEKLARVSTASIVEASKRLLDFGASINFYMFHGGSSFGWSSGANQSAEQNIQPDITSYDYDSPCSEAGHATDKFQALRKLLAQYRAPGDTLIAIPEAPKVIRIPLIHLDPPLQLLDPLPAARKAPMPLGFEALGQDHGYLLYRTHLKKAGRAWLRIPVLHDYALLLINGRYAGSLNRMERTDSLWLEWPQGARLDILVENMGHINYGRGLIDDRKGILGQVLLAGRPLSDWEHFSLPLASPPDAGKRSPALAGQPILQRGQFELFSPGDTWLDMRGWGKGIVFVNGHHLGRFWQIGPQQTLFLPGCWLRKGENEIVIIDLLPTDPKASIQAIERPILNSNPK